MKLDRAKKKKKGRGLHAQTPATSAGGMAWPPRWQVLSVKRFFLTSAPEALALRSRSICLKYFFFHGLVSK